MAAEYFLYTTSYNNTLMERSNSSFAPLPPDTGEIYLDYFIPITQPLYYYRESGGTIVLSSDEIINEYLEQTAPPPTPEENVPYYEYTASTEAINTRIDNIVSTLTGVTKQEFTGYTATTNTRLNGIENNIIYISGVTDTKLNISDFNSYSGTTSTLIGNKLNTSIFNTFTGTTLPANYYNKTQINSYSASTLTNINSRVLKAGDTMTGKLTINNALSVSGVISGNTCVTTPISCGTTRMQSPIVCGSTCVASPITCGTTCVISPITIGSTCVCSPVVLGSTSICSPTICSSTCLCSVGSTRLAGATTAASTLNVSGATKIVGIIEREIVFANPTTRALTGASNFVFDGTCLCVPYVKQTADSAYFYTESTDKCTNATSTCLSYLCGAWSFCAGTYRVDANATVGNSSSNGCSLARITCDGVSIGGSDYLLRSQTANFNFSVAITRDIVFTAGTHCLEIYFWRGANTACITYGAIRAAKIC